MFISSSYDLGFSTYSSSTFLSDSHHRRKLKEEFG